MVKFPKSPNELFLIFLKKRNLKMHRLENCAIVTVLVAVKTVGNEHKTEGIKTVKFRQQRRVEMATPFLRLVCKAE